jgi:multiple sugar transport system substrate-binding protein
MNHLRRWRPSSKKNPDIDVKIEIVNWDNLLQKLTTDIAANANADISSLERAGW